MEDLLEKKLATRHRIRLRRPRRICRTKSPCLDRGLERSREAYSGKQMKPGYFYFHWREISQLINGATLFFGHPSPYKGPTALNNWMRE
jgi:hypothetical protein